jgi:hypothetical protein
MGAPSALTAVDGISPPSGRPQHRGRHQEPATRIDRGQLIDRAWSPPLWAVLALWMLAGASGAYQLAAAAAFVQALRQDTRARGFGRAQLAEAKAEAAQSGAATSAAC